MYQREWQPLPIVTNALVALRRDLNISDAFAYDEMQRCVLLLHEIGQPCAAVQDCKSLNCDVATRACQATAAASAP